MHYKNCRANTGEVLVSQSGRIPKDCVVQGVTGVTGVTMAPIAQQKRLGVGASCTVKLRFLHPKNKVKDKVPNQMATQALSGLIAKRQQEKTIRNKSKECMVFWHEDFRGQLVWALGCYITVDIAGPEESLFAVAEVAAPVAAAQAQQGGQVQQGGNGGDDDDNDVAAQVEVSEPLPPVLQDLVGWQHLDKDDEVAAAAAPMVDDDNELAPQNTLIPNAPMAPDIFSPWGHSGICYHRLLKSVNANLKQKFWTTVGEDPSCLRDTLSHPSSRM